MSPGGIRFARFAVSSCFRSIASSSSVVGSSSSLEGYSGLFWSRDTNVLIPPVYLFKKGKFSHTGGDGGALYFPDSTSRMLFQCSRVKVHTNMTMANNSPRENSRPFVLDVHRRRVFSENCCLAFRLGEEDEARRSIGSCDCELILEAYVDEELGDSR